MPMSVLYDTFDGLIISENRGGQVTEFFHDPHGNVIGCGNSTGSQTYTASYWPYGEVRTSTGTNPAQWGFGGGLGYYTDTVTRIYVRQRDYQPGTGRWMTVDGRWPRRPAYQYVYSQPVRLVDPTGYDPAEIEVRLSDFNRYSLPWGQSYIKNCCEAMKHTRDLNWFNKMVKNGGDWDYKNRYSSNSFEYWYYEPIGNYHFGFVAACAGIPEPVALVGAGVAQDKKPWEFHKPITDPCHGDDCFDQHRIEEGYRDAMLMQSKLEKMCGCRGAMNPWEPQFDPPGPYLPPYRPNPI